MTNVETTRRSVRLIRSSDTYGEGVSFSWVPAEILYRTPVNGLRLCYPVVVTLSSCRIIYLELKIQSHRLEAFNHWKSTLSYRTLVSKSLTDILSNVKEKNGNRGVDFMLPLLQTDTRNLLEKFLLYNI